MRVLVSTTPGKGHIHPVVPLASALRDAGHEVTWATGPESQAHVRSFGFDSARAGMPVAERRAEVQTRNPRLKSMPPLERRRVLFPQTFAAVAGARMLADLEPLLDRLRPDVVLHEAAEMAAPAAASVRGIPNVCVGFGGLVAAAMLEDEAVQDLWARAGTPLRRHAGHFDWLYLHPMPPSLQAVPSGHSTVRPIRPVGADGGEGEPVPAWVEALGRDRPLVYSSFGTEFAMLAPLETIRDAFASLDADVVLTTGATVDPASLDPLPPNVRVERYVPQRFLLDRATAVLSQAGSGITLAACARGLPQVCMPLTADQFDNARMITKAGLGVTVDSTASSSELALVLQRSLRDDGLRRSAAQVASEIAEMPAPESYVGEIEQLPAANRGH